MITQVCPSRNKPCPCGSEKKYKHCCRPDGPEILDVPPFGRVRRVFDVFISVAENPYPEVDSPVYPVFVFQDTGDTEDVFMILDRRLQDEGYMQWFRTPTVGDGPSYSEILACSKQGKPAISASQAFEINMEFANAALICVHVLCKGIRNRSLIQKRS